MAKTYYKREEVEFQNGHLTTATPLTLGNLRKLSAVFEDYSKDVTSQRKIVALLIAKAEKHEAEGGDPQEIYDKFDAEQAEKIAAEEADDNKKDVSWYGTLAAGSLIALKQYKVYDKDGQIVTNLNIDYIEENLDVPTMTRICEIAGTMELGDVGDDVEGKVKE